MALSLDGQQVAPPSAATIAHLTGTHRRLAQLVLECGDYQFEGFKWLRGTFIGIAEHLGVNEKTVQRVAGKEPLHYITRLTKDDGKHVLVKLGVEPSETDLVFRLRATWVRGLAHFNDAAAKAWPLQALKAKEAGLPCQRLLERAAKAQQWQAVVAKLKKAEPISYSVQSHEMGLLRECVKRLSEDAFETVAFLTSWNGWPRFMIYAKMADRVVNRHYHWPSLGPISANPDIALQAYLDARQEEGKINLSESARLSAKIVSLTPSG